jgi:hypothetical protein
VLIGFFVVADANKDIKEIISINKIAFKLKVLLTLSCTLPEVAF